MLSDASGKAAHAASSHDPAIDEVTEGSFSSEDAMCVELNDWKIMMFDHSIVGAEGDLEEIRDGLITIEEILRIFELCIVIPMHD